MLGGLTRMSRGDQFVTFDLTLIRMNPLGEVSQGKLKLYSSSLPLSGTLRQLPGLRSGLHSILLHTNVLH